MCRRALRCLNTAPKTKTKTKGHGRIHKAKRGAEIGLLHAGNAAGACFFSMVERVLLMEGAYANAGVLDWFRFRDDCLFVIKGGFSFKSLWARMEEMAGFFDMKFEDVSTVEIQYLDIVLRREGASILSFPFLRNPGLKRMLSKQSAHPWAVHTSWPRFMMRRVENLTNSHDALVEYKNELQDRLRANDCVLPLSGAGTCVNAFRQKHAF